MLYTENVSLFSRNQFQICRNKFLIDVKTDGETITLRNAVGKRSAAGNTQGDVLSAHKPGYS